MYRKRSFASTHLNYSGKAIDALSTMIAKAFGLFSKINQSTQKKKKEQKR